VDPGRAVFSLTPGEERYDPIDKVHVGISATRLDSAAGHRGRGYGARHRGSCQQGRQADFAQAQLVDAKDRVFTHATSGCVLFPVPRSLR
jgi:acyl-coenzyme A thioesterase PaaI-like protein